MKQFMKDTWSCWLTLVLIVLMFVPDIILGNITWATVTAWFSALTIGSVFGTILSIIVTIANISAVWFSSINIAVAYIFTHVITSK